MAARISRPLTIGLPKGRILNALEPLLAQAGIDLEPFKDSRKLLADSPDGRTRLLLLKPSDVPTYVQYGVADVGIAGADTLLEDGADLCEPLDLGVGACRLVVAAPRSTAHHGIDRAWVKVATKYPNVTREFFRRRGVEAVIIQLYGSVELAAVAGLADLVVDLVESGATLAANDLVEVETIAEVTSRLVVNRASLKTRYHDIDALTAALRSAVEKGTS